ncbi:MAG: prolipoprotein diacylglyceryl transferase [Planctomycetes bacterium]|nr:prolipoprotein diacylglyceryl transferase [Planctomycetota bacterium]
MHRILIEIPYLGIPIYSYGFMMMLAFVGGITIAYFRAKKAGIKPEVVMDIGLYSIICGIVGARLAFIITDFHPDPASDFPLLDMVAIWKGGLTFQGGLFLALAVCIWYLKANMISAAKVADIFAPATAFGVAMGRIGCFLNGCCWGRICSPDFPLGQKFPLDSGVHHHHLQLLRDGSLLETLSKTGNDKIAQSLSHLDPVMATLQDIPLIPVHPAQLYTSAALFAIFGILLVVDKLPGKFDGRTMLVFLMLYSCVRFAIELLRDDTPLLFAFGAYPGLRLGQYLAIATFAVAAGLFLKLRKTNNEKPGISGEGEK